MQMTVLKKRIIGQSWHDYPLFGEVVLSHSEVDSLRLAVKLCCRTVKLTR